MRYKLSGGSQEPLKFGPKSEQACFLLFIYTYSVRDVVGVLCVVCVVSDVVEGVTGVTVEGVIDVASCAYGFMGPFLLRDKKIIDYR